MSLLDGVTRPVLVHAHPDDETLATGALVAQLVRSGLEVHVLTATRGERGEVVAGALTIAPGTEELVLHRETELAEALVVLGVHHHAYVGAPPARADGLLPRLYRDSGMRWVRDGVAGPAADADDRSLTAATVAETAADVAAYVRSVRADLLISYDATGGYGHPDHVHLHEATRVVATLTGVPFVEVVPPSQTDEPGVEVLDLVALLPVVTEALRRHASQLTVDGADVVHSGGQRERIVTRVGLRRVT